jgi:hypothetical protein
LLYLLDANVLIDANRDYYPLSRVPEFWEWLAHYSATGQVKLPVEVYEEIRDGKDDLGIWARDNLVKRSLLLDEQADASLVSRVVDQGYAPDLTDDEVAKIGRDPFLIAYALADLGGRCVVTTERSRPSKQRANCKVPNVCDHFGVAWEDTFGFLRALDFRTDWKQGKP